jgi:hypothetical protein
MYIPLLALSVTKKTGVLSEYCFLQLQDKKYICIQPVNYRLQELPDECLMTGNEQVVTK